MIGFVARRVSSSIFVGRVVERAELMAALEAAQRGEPGLVLIGGEAGIGKSRLAAELRATATTRQARVATGHCLETRAVTLPFAPWIEILRDLLLSARRHTTAALPEVATAELARLIPELRNDVEPAPRPASPDNPVQLFHAILDLIRAVAGEQPLVLLIEDAHWADASSFDLLRFISAALSVEPILVVATFRNDELGEDEGLRAVLGELGRLPRVTRVDLRPFDLREVADQLTGITGRPPPPDVLQRVFARSDGNPFVVEELAGHPPDSPLPPTLRDLMATRLARLSPDTRRLVAAAAAIGRAVGRELLVEIAAIHDRDVLQSLGEATRGHVLVPTVTSDADAFAFRHALIQEFAYGELSASERRSVHGKIARVLTASGGSAGEIARHARLAGDLPVALARTVEAAHQATGALAFAEALAHLQQALALWDDVPEPEAITSTDRPGLYVLAARCAVAIGDWQQAVTLRRNALAVLLPARRAERVAVLLDLADSLSYSADWPGVRVAIEEAAELVPRHPPSAERARVVAELANSEIDDGRLEGARRLAEEAIEIAQACGAATEEVRALIALAQTFSVQLQHGRCAEVLSSAAAIAKARLVSDEYVVATLLGRRGNVANMTGDFEGAIELAEQALTRAARAGTTAQQRPFIRWRFIIANAALGRWAEVERLLDEAQHDTTPMQYEWTVDLCLEVLLRQGRLAEAEAAVRSTDHGYDTPFQGAWTLQARIRLANALGRWPEARAAGDEAIGLFPPEGQAFLYDLLPDMIRGESACMDAAHDRRRPADEAEARKIGLERFDLLRRILGRAIEEGGAGPLVEAILAMAEGEGSRLRGEPDPALWENAVGRYLALAQPWETAYARFRQAQAILVAQGDRPAALELLRAAYRGASKLGARPLVEDIERLARRGRLHIEPAGQPGSKRRGVNDEGVVVSITSRERDVLSLVAAGHTNREIGEALFISEKTASVHITNAMDKLGALSRYDAAASAARLGLLESDEPS